MVNVKRLGENRFKKPIFEIIAFEKKLNLKMFNFIEMAFFQFRIYRGIGES